MDTKPAAEKTTRRSALQRELEALRDLVTLLKPLASDRRKVVCNTAIQFLNNEAPETPEQTEGKLL